MDDHTTRVLEQLVLTEKINEFLRENIAARVARAREGDSPPEDLPPRLPRPEYATTPNLISRDSESLSFFVACEQGRMGDVTRFVQQRGPNHADRQFALEQASFGGQPEVARYLLESGTTLHGNAFERPCPKTGSASSAAMPTTCIFDEKRTQDPLKLVEIFMEHGWNPNQAWNSPKRDWPVFPLHYIRCLTDRPLLELLLSHGADPNLEEPVIPSLPHNFGSLEVKRHGGRVLNMAAKLFDPSIIDLLLTHGARPEHARLLHCVATWHSPVLKAESWSRRRPFAEYLVSRNIADVNEVKQIPPLTAISRPPGVRRDATPFSEACSAQDWEFAEWLLERGADPDALDGLAFTKQWWMEPYFGPNDPQKVTELVKAVRSKGREG